MIFQKIMPFTKGLQEKRYNKNHLNTNVLWRVVVIRRLSIPVITSCSYAIICFSSYDFRRTYG